MDEPVLKLDNILTRGVLLRDVHNFINTCWELNAKIAVQNDCDRLHCVINDSSNRTHYCVISFTYPSTYVIVDSNLFQTFDKIDYPLLEAAVVAFKLACSNLAPFFETVDIIDNNFVVINPPLLKYKQCHRTVSVDCDTSWVCAITPQGSLKDMYIQTSRGQLDMPAFWDQDKGVIENYYRIFAPMLHHNTQAGSGLKEEKSTECSVCMSDEVLENGMTKCLQPNCGAYYHYDCIYEWFIACCQEMRLDEISGNCPKCETPMVVTKRSTFNNT